MQCPSYKWYFHTAWEEPNVNAALCGHFSNVPRQYLHSKIKKITYSQETIPIKKIPFISWFVKRISGSFVCVNNFASFFVWFDQYGMKLLSGLDLYGAVCEGNVIAILVARNCGAAAASARGSNSSSPAQYTRISSPCIIIILRAERWTHGRAVQSVLRSTQNSL
jgi:hypothetical protein